MVACWMARFSEIDLFSLAPPALETWGVQILSYIVKRDIWLNPCSKFFAQIRGISLYGVSGRILSFAE